MTLFGIDPPTPPDGGGGMLGWLQEEDPSPPCKRRRLTGDDSSDEGESSYDDEETQDSPREVIMNSEFKTIARDVCDSYTVYPSDGAVMQGGSGAQIFEAEGLFDLCYDLADFLNKYNDRDSPELAAALRDVETIIGLELETPFPALLDPVKNSAKKIKGLKTI